MTDLRHVPFIHSVLKPSALVTELLSEYELGTGVDCSLLAHNLNDTYMVRAHGNRFILRVYQAQHSESIDYEVDLLLHLARKGLSVSVPVARKDGTHATALTAPEGLRFAVLFTYANGQAVTTASQSPKVSRVYGRTLASIHSAAQDFVTQHSRAPSDLSRLLEGPLSILYPFLAHRPDDWRRLQAIADQLRTYMAQVPQGTMDAGPCHGDAHGGNANLSEDGSITFFDFDLCADGWRAYDTAVFHWGAAMGIPRLGRSKEEAAALCESFMEGYGESRTLSDADLKAIPLMKVLRQVWFMGFTAANSDNWGPQETDDRYFDREIAFLNHLTASAEKA